MFGIRTVFFTILLILLSKICYPQSSSYYFKNYQVNNGLSSNTITSILQDKKGFMWFGSRNGLNRFDGNSFKTFQNKLSDSTSIGSNSIFCLFEDSKERIWVGTYKGVYIYNPLQENFTTFKPLHTGEVRYIKGDQDQNIWIISDFHLYKYHIPSKKLSKFSFSTDQIVTLHIAGNGSVWIATNNGVVKKYNPNENTFTDYAIAKNYKNHNFSMIKDLSLINETTLMVGTMKQVFLFDLNTSNITFLFNNNEEVGDIHIHSIYRHSPIEYWFGTETGLYVYNIQSGETTIVQKEYNNPYSISENTISSIYKDTEGGIWLGTYFGGINYYSQPFNNFKKYFPQPQSNKPTLSGYIVHEICKDQYGKLWIGTEDAGLNRFDPADGSFKNFKADKTKGSISYQNIHGLLAVGDELWIGTYEHGLDVMDLKTQKVVRHYHSGIAPGSFTSNFIITLYKTKNSDILVGTWNGLFTYNREHDDFTQHPFFNIPIQVIHEDDMGTIWVGSYGNGIYYQNTITNKKGRLQHSLENKDGIVNNYVTSLFEDSKKNIWVSTEGGVSHLEVKTGKIINYTVEDGLPDNQIFRIEEDNQNMLWISTSKGLSKFNPEQKTFTNYHNVHGLPTEQFNYNSSFKDHDGTLYFGTVKGLISFNPQKFIKNEFIPPVYITDLQINNQGLRIGKEDSHLEKAVLYTSTIALPYDQSNLSLDVAALSYTIPEMNSYQYKMDGFDENWVELKNNRKIYYSKLPPGDYLFRLKGSNNEHLWNEKETVVKIKISPPIWATTTAFLIYSLIVFFIAYTIYRYYYLAIKEKRKRKIEVLEIKKEREIYHAKIDFFTNVAHEIRTPLTLIKLPLDRLILKMENSPECKEGLGSIKNNTERLIDLTNQLLDFRKAEADHFSLNFTKSNINALLDEFYLQFKLEAEQKELTYQLEKPHPPIYAFIDKEAFRKIITNLVNNAIKYSSTFVQIHLLTLGKNNQELCIEIKNDGDVIQEESKDKIFEPFYRVSKTHQVPGTGIGLSLARSLTELHRGKLKLKGNKESLNIFKLTLPIHQPVESHFEEVQNDDDIGEDILNEDQHTTILIVEDNKEILHYLRKELAENYLVLQAENGKEALEVLKNNTIQLVISDIMMPIMDGIELCKIIKDNFNFSHIPVILLTAKNTINSKIEGLEIGADAYIEKPFSFDHLFAQINNLLNNRNIIREYFNRSPLPLVHGIATTQADKEFLERFNRVIYENINDEDLNVDKLSSLMNMSRPTLYRKIKGLSDLTPNELINLTRLKRGAELIAEGYYKINEVANLIGYSHSSNFSRDFQKQFGMSPSKYLKSLTSPIKHDSCKLENPDG